MPLQKIFFSYSRQDGAEFSLKLAVDLKKHGFNVWIDQQDIRAGTEWDLEIEKALETCDCLLFVETERSVVSNHVLDEVHYALEQNKKVIPLIVKDSKTPFRVQRIQHIDFTRDYETGLNKLIRELQTSSVNTFVETSQVIPHRKPFFQKNAGWLTVALGAVIITMAVLWYNSVHREMLIGEVKKANNETVTTQDDNTSTDNTIVAGDTQAIRSVRKIEPSAESKKKTIAGEKADRSSAKKAAIDLTAMGGDWELSQVDLKVRTFDGYLKITPAGDKKFNIRSHLRFFYIQPKDTMFLSIFNAFAGCSDCLLEDELDLAVEDIAIGSQVYSILKHDQEGVGKAGDTVMDRGANKSIRGTAVLQFTGNKTAVIKVARSTPVTLEGGLVLKPFAYLFTFKKLE